MFFAIFLFFWLGMFVWQFRSPERYNGDVDMKNYAFCSNLIFTFPAWLILVLFLNKRLVKLPLPIVVGQMANYGFFSFFCIRQYIFHSGSDFYIPLLKVWGITYIVLLVIMAVDHQIYCLRHKK